MIRNTFVFKLKADFLKALAHTARLRIIGCLQNGEVSVGSLCKRLEMEQSVISKHLAVLKQAGLVQSRQERVTVYYSVKDREVYAVLRSVNQMLKRRLQEGQKALDQLSEA